MYSVSAFAQTVPMPSPTDSTPTTTVTTGSNTGAAISASAELAKVVGPVWFFAIACFVSCILLVLGAGFMFYKFGGKLFDRLESFLNGIQGASATNAQAITLQTSIAGITKTNVVNLVDAGHNFANAVQKIGKEIGADVENDCDKIREKLRTVVST